MTVKREKATFPNRAGHSLSALLERPAGTPVAFVVFAHCFTCGKDIAAASRISRALAARDIAVLRFDFTGLGSSDGDFANTDFSSNVEDLIAAADFLRERFQAPSMLIGHSLGGAAVLAAADRVPEARAVVTIGAPSGPDHIKNQFGEEVMRIRREGVATVDLAGRPFTVRREFLDDIETYRLDEKVAAIGKALLICHSPMDTTVSINEAAHLYGVAKHPKSFLSLDNADHLLTRREDAEYVAQMIAAWSGRYVAAPTAPAAGARQAPSGEVEVFERNQRFLRDVVTDDHFLQADEPVDPGGSNIGPDPYELLLASLGACTSMTIRMYANQKKWSLDDVRVRLRHDREHAKDCEACDESDRKLSVITRYIALSGDLTEPQRSRLMEIANRCPVHKTLLNLARIDTLPHE
ncbi:MAG TPA: bifunctional alpha/beta hydrolase/OsmC family protein [Gammaproteobacteria bacterium]|nr:bifunctional alpha/beta hydrolase/OsmC family protein [Gammaproteobacteria bacterium]